MIFCEIDIFVRGGAANFAAPLHNRMLHLIDPWHQHNPMNWEKYGFVMRLRTLREIQGWTTENYLEPLGKGRGWVRSTLSKCVKTIIARLSQTLRLNGHANKRCIRNEFKKITESNTARTEQRPSTAMNAKHPRHWNQY